MLYDLCTIILNAIYYTVILLSINVSTSTVGYILHMCLHIVTVQHIVYISVQHNLFTNACLFYMFCLAIYFILFLSDDFMNISYT